MKSISTLLALLLVIGIVFASTILVSKIITAQVSRSSEAPVHLQAIDKDVMKISPNVYEVEVVFYNPSDRVFKVYPEELTLYTDGFMSSAITLIIDSNTITLSPGETGKLEVVGKSTSKVDVGVVVLIFYVEDVGSGTGYRDVIVVPMR